MPAGGATIGELVEARDLLQQLTSREIRGRYRGAVLGQFWGLLNPLALMLIYTVVFSRVLRVAPPVGHPSGLDIFALWVLCGLLPWTFLNNCLTSGLGALVGNAGLVTKVWFPREVLVVAASLAWLVSFGFELLVLLGAIAVAGNPKALLWAFAVMPLMVLLLMFGTGVALALSVLNVYFRDTAQFVGIATQLWFYLTPIVYPEGLVPGRLRPLVELNPMTSFVGCFRSLLYDGALPSAHDLVGVTLAAVLGLTVGYAVFRRFEARLAEEL